MTGILMDTLVRVSADLFEVGQIYGYRVERAALERELRFDPRKVLLDPYGRAIARPANYSRVAATKPGDNFATALKSVVTDVSRYDWEGDEPLRRPFSRTVIYEMHVAGFTKHPSSGVDPAKRGISSGQILQRNRGTFLAKNGKDFSRYLGLIFLAKEGI